jgi:DNA-binding MarR family transcriptional regulator
LSELDDVVHAVVEVNRLLRGAGERLAAAAGQTHARRMVLQAAAGGVTVAEIARALGLVRQSVQRTANELVADGLATYAENPQHKRAKLLCVTPSGQAVLTQIEQIHSQWITSLDQGTGDRDDWRTVHRALRQLADTLRMTQPTG